MDSTLALDGVREALRMSLLLAGPLLAAALLVGLVVGALQTMSQLHEPTVALVPRLVAVAVSLLIVLPWLFSTWVAYAADLWRGMPAWLG